MNPLVTVTEADCSRHCAWIQDGGLAMTYPACDYHSVMDTLDQAKVGLVANFIDTTAPRFHAAFGVPSKLNMSTLKYETQEIADLKETLDFHRKAGKYVDFTSDLTRCSWDDVHQELAKAQEAAERSVKGGKQPHRRLWRNIGSTSSVLAPGLAALPDELCMLHGGLALVFSVSQLPP